MWRQKSRPLSQPDCGKHVSQCGPVWNRLCHGVPFCRVFPSIYFFCTVVDPSLPPPTQCQQGTQCSGFACNAHSRVDIQYSGLVRNVHVNALVEKTHPFPPIFIIRTVFLSVPVP